MPRFIVTFTLLADEDDKDSPLGRVLVEATDEREAQQLGCAQLYDGLISDAISFDPEDLEVKPAFQFKVTFGKENENGVHGTVIVEASDEEDAKEEACNREGINRERYEEVHSLAAARVDV